MFFDCSKVELSHSLALLCLPYIMHENGGMVNDLRENSLVITVGISFRNPETRIGYNIRGKKNEISVQNKQIGSLAQHHPSAIGNGIAAGADGRHRINFFAAGFIDTIHTWLQKKDRRGSLS